MAVTREPALWVCEERFRVLVRVTKTVVWSRAADGSFVSPQPAWEIFTGQTLDNYKGFGWVNAHAPVERERARMSWSNPALLEPGAFYERLSRVWSHAHNSYRSVLIRAAARTDANGTICEWIGSDVDI